MNRKQIFTKTDAVLEIMGYLFHAAAFTVAAVACATVAEIPVRLDSDNNVLEYGSPGFLFVLPATMIVCNIIFSVVIHFVDPKVWNLPFTPRPGREIAVYRDMVRMLTVLELLFGGFTFAYNFCLFRDIRRALTPLTIFLVLGVFADIAAAIAVSARHNRKR